jgi:hypothetical protein
LRRLVNPRLVEDVTDVPESGDEVNDDFPEPDLGDEEDEDDGDDDDFGNDDIERSAMLMARALSS